MYQIEIWTDGACSGNPGFMGVGVVLKCGDKVKEISEGKGHGTNIRAELLAAIAGLEALRYPERSKVTLYTDSAQVQGVFSGWRIKTNLDLANKLKELAGRCAEFRVVKVNGHSGLNLNEVCDRLAKDATVSAGASDF